MSGLPLKNRYSLSRETRPPLISYWTERIGLTAALATIRKHKQFNVPEHLTRVGKRIQSGWKECADNNSLRISVSGILPLSHFSFDYENGQEIRTLFTQEMLQRGFLATNAFYASYAHQESHIESYMKAMDEVFGVIAKAVERSEVEKALKGPVAHSGFQRLT
ncbi:MAG: hypothetical protein KJ907_02505 [Actinobacteria bacterium]|nr:hypothetical protein [Actinomycetota bacterium]MBU4401593.1 hypothetical protein [Actinomycetota bacterium]MCG2820044.1 hypothetical protein [Actinomycetes bacterium]